MKSRFLVATAILAAIALLPACSSGSNDVAGPENTVEVLLAGTGTGHVVDGGAYINCPGTCGPSDWSPGLTVYMTATADSGSVFVSWSGDCTGTDPAVCSFVVNGHMSVTATFNTIP
jgi:hypothetical protein